MKRAPVAVAGFLALCLPLSAQRLYRPDIFSLNNSFPRFPSLTLLDGGRSSSFSFNWIEMATPDFLPALSTARPQKADTASSGTLPTDSSKEVVDVRPKLLDYVGGEVGFLYGRSSGKFGRDVEAGYIIGDVGNDKFHISVGAAYENSSRHH